MKNRALSFRYAFNGLWVALKDQPNLLLHFSAAVLAIVLGFYFDISETEWLSLIIVVGFVISLELTNTAIEEVVNSFTDDHHPSAKIAKDVAAGAVLVASITAFVIGLLIFLPKVLALLT